MMIELNPEQARILDRATKSGMSPEEALNQAFAILEDQLETEAWMLENRDEIAAHIEKGCAQADRGELYGPEEVKHMLRERRAKRNVA